jgi:glycosyltransferase involved in cell wall biosynthesis
MEHLYKAQDVLLDAVTGLPSVERTLVGDGRCRRALEARAERMGLTASVRFRGALPAGEPVRRALDDADLFVLPSRQEGLPRAMIEAMARGLPCLGSAVGGVGELLPQDCLVAAGDAQSLRAKILTFAADPARMAREAAGNLVRAREYHEDALRRRRRAFYAETARLARTGPGAADG